MLRVSGFRNPKRKRGTELRSRLTMQKGPSLTLRVMKNQTKRCPDRVTATNSATSKLTLRVTTSDIIADYCRSVLVEQPDSSPNLKPLQIGW